MIASAVVAMERFTAILAIVAGVAAILLLIGRFVPIAAPMVEAVRPARLWLAFLVAAASTAGSLYFSEVANFTPCKLCWLQRIAMYPLSAILLVGALRRDSDVRWYALPIAGVGAVISTYHFVIERRPSLGSGSCDITAPCTVPWFTVFGFITLAFMALCGFVAIISLLTLGDSDDGIENAEDAT